MQAAEESSRQEIQVMQDALVVAGQVKVDLHKAQAALHEEVAFPDVLPFQVFSPNICKQMAGDFLTDPPPIAQVRCAGLIRPPPCTLTSDH